MSPPSTALFGLLCLSLFLILPFAQGLRFEAEKAHLIGALRNKELPGHSHTGYADYYLSENHNKNTKIIFTANIPSDGVYPVKLRYASHSDSVFSIHANGHRLVDSDVPFSKSWTEKVEQLPLRTGLNTIVVQMEKASKNIPLSLDYIEIDGAVDLVANGATLPFVEFEAENANTNAGTIGPDRTYMNLPSEASQRQAIQLSQPDHYVEFTTNQDCNGLSIRFSIPDSSDGNGLTANIGVLVNDNQVLNLSINSHFSWAYGAYPFTKNPADGSPHHFFDEVRSLFPDTVSSGSTVRLVPLSTGVVITIDLIDFYTVPAPYTQPGNFLSITDYGADPNGQSDSTGAIQNCINDANGQGKGVWIPQGTFLVTTRYTLNNNQVVRGAGPWYSIVKATVNHGVGFFGNWAPQGSNNVQLYDFAMSGDTNVRDDSAVDSGSGGALDNSLIQNVWIEHTKCGFWFDGPFDGLHITGVTIKNTYADGVNFHLGITNSVVEQSLIRNTGDDALAMWAQTTPDQNNVFQFNTIQMPVLANGVAIYGGSDNSATDNYVADTICEGGGLQVSNRFGAVPLGGTTTVERNVIVRTGAPNRYNSDHNGAIWVWAGDEAMTSTVNFNNIDVQDSSYAGITFWGTNIQGLTFNNITIDTSPYAYEVESVTGSATFNYVVATNLASGGANTCDPGFSINQGPGNSGWTGSSCCNGNCNQL